jgi:16S rRNA (cytosine1402-N4)-methyltransferase
MNVRPDGIYLDATAGLGGHTGRIASMLTTGLVIACDRDELSLDKARANTAEFTNRIWFRQGTFADLAEALSDARIDRVDGLLADLGVSRYQLTTPERGFSFLSDGPLDMRQDTSQTITAADLVNHTAEEALADLIYQFGGERRARRVARAIVRARPLRSTLHLADVVERAVPRTGKTHPATQTFMALRMAVNDEPGQLDQLLAIGPELIAHGGRMVVISFSSGEDRKVKEKFKSLGHEGRAVILTKRPLEPSEEETRVNPASRSAKLRALEMK